MSKQLSQPDSLSFQAGHSDSEPVSRGHTQPFSSRASTNADSSELSSPPDSPRNVFENFTTQGQGSESALEKFVTTESSFPVKGNYRNDNAATRAKLDEVKDQFLKDMDGRFIKMDCSTFLETFLPDNGLAPLEHDLEAPTVNDASTEAALQTQFVSF